MPDTYPLSWARLWLMELQGCRGIALVGTDAGVRAVCDALYDGGWDALEATARADYAAGCVDTYGF